jgi:hypothetical protein
MNKSYLELGGNSIAQVTPLTAAAPQPYVPVMFTSNNQVWDTAVARNTAALKVILASLVALLAAYGGTEALKVPRAIRSTILLVLRPAESALRRLIVIAARNVTLNVAAAKVKPSSPVPKTRPKEPNAKNRSSHVSFQLFDPRKRFGQRHVTYTSLVPRISFIAPDPPFTPLAMRPPEPPLARQPDPELGRDIGARRLCIRLKAITTALEDVPRQAKRLVRWQVQRENRREKKKTFIAPLRPGTPPGHRSIPRSGVDFILAECHDFAKAVLAEPQRSQTSSAAAPNTS